MNINKYIGHAYHRWLYTAIIISIILLITPFIFTENDPYFTNPQNIQFQGENDQKVERVTQDPLKKTRRLRRAKKPKQGITTFADIPESQEHKKAIDQAIIQPQISGMTKAAEEPVTDRVADLKKTGSVYLGAYMQPWKGLPEEIIESINLENEDLGQLLKILANNLHINFITDDTIEPTRAEGLQPVAGTKITFRANTTMTLKQLWEIGVTFIEMAGFSIVPSTTPRTYRVTSNKVANKDPMPTFIGTDTDLLPNSDAKIRYVYFADNADLNTMKEIATALQSNSAAPLIAIPQLRALIMTDKSANVKSLLQVMHELDKVNMPETLSIIRLRHTDAQKVADLYNQLIGKTDSSAYNPFAPQRKPTTTQYFTAATRVFAEPRTNSLIVLGTKDNIKKFEEFVLTHIDKTLDLPFSPLHVIQLKFIEANSLAQILSEVIGKFNAEASNKLAADFGGVRDGNKFFRPTLRITAEPFSNRLIINSDYEEYLKLREIIERLDVEQPQVAIKVLILNVDLTNREALGTQLRSIRDCCDNNCGPNVTFQSAQLGPVITNDTTGVGTGAIRLLGNLINLAAPVTSAGVTSSLFETGSTLVTLGRDMFGIWGLLRALETLTRVSVIANPFLITTHKYRAEVRIGETRRVTTATVEGTRSADAFGDLRADLVVIITPQISYDDMITLNIYVEQTQFTDLVGGNRITKKLSTEALVANREVIALGGLIRDIVSETETGVPFLKDIPLIGWLFKNKIKRIDRNSLLILISPEIIKVHDPAGGKQFTYQKISAAKRVLYDMQFGPERRDPLHRWIFKDHLENEVNTIDKFVAIQEKYLDHSQLHKEKDLGLVALQDGKNNKSKTEDKTIKNPLNLINDGKSFATQDPLLLAQAKKNKEVMNKKSLLDLVAPKNEPGVIS